MKNISKGSLNVKHQGISFLTLGLLHVLLFSCADFVEIDAPRTDLVRETVFSNDASAEAAVTDLYYQMATKGFSNGFHPSFNYAGALSSDEYVNYNTGNVTRAQFNDNQITSTNTLNSAFWSELYLQIYTANAIVEGLVSSSDITESLKSQLRGEALFIRAFHYFYLVNLYGDIPLVLTTDYNINKSIGRTSSNEIYDQIIADLVEARAALPDEYSASDGLRIRVNKAAASTLLSRVYLYIEDWSSAETEATAVIDNPLYTLETDLTKVFRTTSSEAIFQLWSEVYPLNYLTFNFYPSVVNTGSLRPEFVNDFEADDQRWTIWGASTVSGGVTYYYTTKYNDSSIPSLDFSTVLRLAELYLIRAEARTKQNKLTEAASDINLIRNRAGLGNTTSTTQDELLNSVIQERRSELYLEWGHRWLDLKRTKLADQVLSPVKGPDKWQPTDVLYPIPQAQIQNDPAMTNAQNPGY